jgi:hypothetical protein
LDSPAALVRRRFLERVDLASQQARRHEMTAAPRQTRGDEVEGAAQIDQPGFRPFADDDLPI